MPWQRHADRGCPLNQLAPALQVVRIQQPLNRNRNKVAVCHIAGTVGIGQARCFQNKMNALRTSPQILEIESLNKLKNLTDS